MLVASASTAVRTARGSSWVRPVVRWGEASREPGPAIDLSEQVGHADRRQVRVERSERPFGLVGGHRLERRDAQPPGPELNVLKRVRLDLCSNLGQPACELRAAFGQPLGPGVRQRHGKRPDLAHGGEHGRGDELLLDRAVASASFHPHIARAQPAAQLCEHAELKGAPVHAIPPDSASPSLADEAKRRIGGELAQATLPEQAHDLHALREAGARGHGPEREGLYELRPDLAQDGEVGPGELDGVEWIGANEMLRLVHLRSEFVPADDLLDRRAPAA